ncbi:MAG: BREX-1 system adenine-specific DNA-methyltransferase PglX, partial [Actinomycetota bacterium]|nr:BREX-1 system adenine-specific DNA-methyltransferase PglX [Actinomycetota bacterium]
MQGIADPERGRLFTQRLFNRLMFLAFIQKKGWLAFDGSQDYLNALWRDYRRDERGENFYRERLKLLFFTGLNTPNEVDVRGINDGGYTRDLIGAVPYLNGGLFERNPDGTDDEDSVVSVPDEAVALILTDLFGRFNFTVTESTPLDIEVAVDPEMLGRVFEELVTGRHETGSYYTPKPIVSFMCREALKGHLGAELTEDPPETINAFVDGHDPEGLHDPEEALRALQNVTVCDPACGSGAYLLGMLHELLDLRASLFRARDLDARSTYARKLQIIQKNLYGVDVDPFAVNIARLRLWLSLVVDYDGDDDPPPLPNLDFKIEAGDSLIAPDPSGGLQTDMFRNEQVSRLEGFKSDFLEAHGEEKKRLRREIESLRAEIAGWAHPDAAGATNGFDWQVEFAEIFAKGNSGGFDAVLANPPYVRMELFKEIKPTLRKNFPEAHSDRADLYVYFYARALQLLKDGGMLSFISSNKWFRANYGKNLRKHIADTCHVSSITDFGDLPVFQSASAYPMIFAAQKGRNAIGGPTSFTQVKSLDAPYPDVDALIRTQGSPLPDDSITGPDWSLTDAATADRLKKMRASGVPLGEYVKGQIYYGIKTGFNKAFVIDGAKREELISQDPNSAEIIKPFVVGKDVRKWAVDYKDRWLIVTPIGINMKRYPAVFDHLKQWQPELEKRYDKGKHWWELRACDYYSAFDRRKIAFPDIAKNLRFAFDAEQM